MSNKPAPNDQELRELKKKLKIGKKLQPREKSLAEAATLLAFKKNVYEGSRGRLILEDRKREVIVLIEEACRNEARHHQACWVVGISIRTLYRWKKSGVKDNRKGSVKRVARKLPQASRNEILEQCNSERF